MCVAASRRSFAPRRSPASIASAWARRFVDAVGPVAVERSLGVHAGDGVALDAVAEVRVREHAVVEAHLSTPLRRMARPVRPSQRMWIARSVATERAAEDADEQFVGFQG
jgi:hypothetical protein